MTTPLWTLTDLVAATGGSLDQGEKTGGLAGVPPAGCGAGPADRAAVVTGISIDTRSLQPGDLFVALADVRDGHDFVPAAFRAGAAAALVKPGYVGQPGDGALIRVNDPLRALERLGLAARARLSADARVVAVTGSAGKTTTKEMLRACFAALAPGRVHASEKSYNNHWGVPLTLARMPADTAFAVFEIGMNHPGEIRPLVGMVRPHVAVVTTIAPAHLGHFASLDAIADAKAEIFEGLGATGDGVTYAILPRDSAQFDRLEQRAAAATGIPRGDFGDYFGLLSFGAHADAHCRLLEPECRFHPDASDVVFAIGGETVALRVGVAGRHNAINAAAVLSAILAATAGLDLPASPDDVETLPGLAPVLAALATLRLDPAGRGQVHALAEGITLIDESYNANPASVAAALATLALYPAERRRVAILGDMLELGDQGAALHAGLAEAVAANRVDLVLTAGPLMRHLHDALPAACRGPWAETAAQLGPAVLAAIRPGDVVMIKGSNGSRMGPLVEALKGRYASADR